MSLASRRALTALASETSIADDTTGHEQVPEEPHVQWIGTEL
jgi:hypothetical protein